MSFYEDIADYYDVIFPFNKGHVDFVKSCIEEPYRSKIILDIGCGTGDLAVALGEIDFHVTGIDYDTEMLRKAEQKRKDSVDFKHMDMREIGKAFPPASFDAILCFGNTLVHLNSISEVDAFCRQVRTVVKNGGKFLLQILNYDHILDHHIDRLPLIENDIVRFERAYEYDDSRRVIHFKTRLTLKEAGRVIENEILLYPLRKQELDDALRGAGFTDISYYADFDKGPLQEESLPLVTEAG